MHWRDALLRLRALLFRREMDEELNEELQFHLEMQARKNQAESANPADASAGRDCSSAAQSELRKNVEKREG